MLTICLNGVERCCISIKCQRMTLSFLKSSPATRWVIYINGAAGSAHKFLCGTSMSRAAPKLKLVNKR